MVSAARQRGDDGDVALLCRQWVMRLRPSPLLSHPFIASGVVPILDASALFGPHRLVTQEEARSIYEQHDATGRPLYDGIRYLSRLNPTWECWAVFGDRLRHSVLRADVIPANHPGLYDAARTSGLAID